MLATAISVYYVFFCSYLLSENAFFVSSVSRVPGMAFVNEQLYRELNESELQRMASAAVQQQFYKVIN